MRRSNPTRGHGGPLMTEHIQLRDLDLELELLKRKREMIEQQQQILTSTQTFNRPRPFEYGNNQPRPLFSEQHQPFSNNTNFSRFYNDAPQPQGFGGSGAAKRHADPPVWQAHSAPKRFSGPPSGPKKKFGSGPGPKPNSNSRQQAPGSSYSGSQFNKPSARQWDNKPKPYAPPKSTFPSQRFNNAPKGAKPQQRDFRPSKVTKPKPPQKGNKLAPATTTERKKFAQATKSSKDDDFTGDENILRLDVVPSVQMAGRLELALGNILKEIKAKFGDAEPNAAMFQSTFLTRKMKQAIRERLRGVMMGKPVGKVTAIVDHYRKVFPPETDAEILEVGQALQKSNPRLAIKLEGAETAFKYMKVNMNKLIGVTLDDIFEKLQTVYEKFDEEKTKEICETIIADAIDFTKDVEEAEADKIVSGTGNDSNAKDGEDAVQNGETAVENGESAVESDETAMENGKTTVETGENTAENSETVEDAERTTENVEDNQTTDDKASEENTTDETKEISDEKPTSDVKPLGKAYNKNHKFYDFQKPEWKKVDNGITSLIQRRLPYILPKFKPQLLKLLNAVGTFKVTKTAIIDKTQNLIDLENRIERAEKSMDTTIDLSQSDNNVTSTPKHTQTNKYSYMVKIHGRPALPKRKLMQEFLDEYKPTSVKKHRNMPMLFVSFGDKDACDRIVAVKETLLGNCMITIKPTEKTIAKQNQLLNNSAVNDSPEKIIGSDLDDQINDLLSSIREEEESTRLENDDNDVEIVPESDNPEAVGEAVTNEESADNGTDQNVGEEATEKQDGNEATETQDGNKQDDVNEETEMKVDNDEAKDKVEALKEDAKETGRATPTRTSTRLANVTPSSVRTRRASRLAQN